MTATRFYAVVMCVAWMLLMLVLEWGYGPDTGRRGGALLLLLPGAAFFALNRFDVLPALLTALSFAALGRRRVGLAAVALGAATLLKVYPVLFVPLILRYLWPRRPEAMRFAAAYGATGLLALTPLLLGADWTAVLGPYKYQLTRPPEHGLTIYGCLLPVDVAEGAFGSLFRLSVLSTTVALVIATPIRDLGGLLRRCAAVLLVFVTLAVFYSPQWIIWFAPLLAPLARRERPVAAAAAGLDIVNYLTFPVWFWVLPAVVTAMAGGVEQDWLVIQIGNWLRLARFLCCGYLLWRLVRPEYPWRAWLARLRTRAHGTTFARSGEQ